MKKSVTLAASFVITTSTTASIGLAGCKKTTDDGGGNDSVSVYRSDPRGCFYSVPMHCPKGATCNPPAPPEVDCPPELQDAGDAPAVTRRPPGKENWVRMKPRFWTAGAGKCSYEPEYFCAPKGAPSCTPKPAAVEIACQQPDAGAAGPVHTASFVYKDGIGQCHKVPETDCKSTYECAFPDGEIVQCP